MSETNKHRSLFLPFCIGNGIDIGYGGSPIVETAITIDLPEGERYSFTDNKPQNISCSADNLFMFADNGLDWAFSSHLLEDFTDTRKILKEWLRVIKVGGYLSLLLPDEAIYRKRSKTYNVNHKIPFFSLEYILNILIEFPVNVVYSKQLFENDDYNFCVVMIKKDKQNEP